MHPIKIKYVVNLLLSHFSSSAGNAGTYIWPWGVSKEHPFTGRLVPWPCFHFFPSPPLFPSWFRNSLRKNLSILRPRRRKGEGKKVKDKRGTISWMKMSNSWAVRAIDWYSVSELVFLFFYHQDPPRKHLALGPQRPAALTELIKPPCRLLQEGKRRRESVSLWNNALAQGAPDLQKSSI